MTSKKSSKKSKGKDKSKKKSKESAQIKQEIEEYANAKIEKPTVRHVAPKQYSLSRVGAEILMTDEENYEPYVSPFNTATQTESSDEESEGEESESKGYVLHMGEIMGRLFVSNITSMSFESDYKEMNSSGSLKVDNIDLNWSYKGVRTRLLSEWQFPEEKVGYAELKESFLGFITEQTFSDNNVDIKVNGMPLAMEEKVQFEFKGMKRSEILREVILTAGLKPFINVDGLDDDVTDFTNKSSDKKDDSSSEATGGEGEEIDSLVKKIIGSETDELKKAKLIHDWLKSNVKYKYYECTRYDTPEKCLKNKGHLNCADTARLTRAMMASAGLKCYVVHRTTNGGHFWTIIEIGGKKYASDQTGSGAEFNTVWAKSGRKSVSDGGSYTRKNGDNPDC